jgi:hypothetical protein
MSNAPRVELRATYVPQVLIALLLFIPLAMMLILAPLAPKLVAIAMIAGYIWLCVVLRKRRLIIDAQTICKRGPLGGETVIAWDDVSHYTYWSMGQQNVYAAGAGGLAGAAIVGIAMLIVRKMRGGKGANRRFNMGQLVIYDATGRKIALGNHYKNVIDALDLAFEQLHARLRGRPRNYAPFTLTDSELVHEKKGSLGLADIEKVHTAQASFSVKKRGKRLAWARVHMKRINNVMLLVEDLAERGLVIDAQSEVFVPPPVLSKLREASARQAALPRAELRRR